MKKILTNEVVLKRLVIALIALLISFGAPISSSQQSAVVEAVSAIVAIIALSDIARVTVSTKKADEAIDVAFYSDPEKDDKPTI